ncbi:DUF2953 domain-containing protein [Shimazuella sp. AN120528]|uniref:DUF2953 domain-containing protein n=1 Tax=Shimazuella soli TaxID=1892854 RepID=UPI001F10DC49|nr:DUF2953 domain-containing protein [Shimazuella soli]MCH5584280.1 DUF2953 domain-containing protein [Shimazuella soli]
MGMFILIVVLGLGLLIYFSKIKIEINYKRTDKQDKGELKVRALGGLLHYRLSIPTIDFKNVDKGVKVESNKESSTDKKAEDTFINKDKIEFLYENYEDLLHRVKYFQESVRWFMSRVHCTKWDWETNVGTGDAAEAGVLTGMIWGVKTTVLGFFSHYIQWDSRPQIEVTPCFQQALLDTSFVAKFSFTFGSAVRFLLLLWFRFKKSNKKSHILSTQRISNM